MVEKLEDAPITAKEIARWTQRDPLMSIVFRHIADGWPTSPTEDVVTLLDKAPGVNNICGMHFVVWKSHATTRTEESSE